jgi:hypothetical protein
MQFLFEFMQTLWKARTPERFFTVASQFRLGTIGSLDSEYTACRKGAVTISSTNIF